MNSTKFTYIESLAISDTGLVRNNNEDSYAVLQNDGCFFVADGMGGGDAGELASQIVEDNLTEAILNTSHDSPGLRKYNVQQAIHCANQNIIEYSKKHNFSQMGSTLALLLFDSWNSQNAFVCHIGDSRVYCYRNKKLNCITRDHTIGSELKALQGNKSNKLSHVLTRAVGTSNIILPEWQQILIKKDDYFLICSDGVSSMLDEKEIEKIFVTHDKLDKIILELEKQIRLAGAKDNYTMICCKINSIVPIEKEHTVEEQQENSYLLKISEERIDNV